MKNSLLVGLLMVLATCMTGQGGVSFKAGVGTLITDDANFTQSGAAHYGWRLAGFARIGASDTWFFHPGLSYERYNLVTSPEFNAFDSEPQLHFVKGYINLAFFLVQNKAFKMRLSGGGNLSYLAAVDDNNHQIDLNTFNDATLGLNGMLGLDFWFLTLDLGYEHSLTGFFHDTNDSTSRFWTLSAGVFF